MTTTLNINSVKVSDELRRAIEADVKVVLDVGCGFNKQTGAYGVDKRDVDGVDLVWDLEDIPYPLPDECATAIIASHLIEHIKPWLQIDIMNEWHRLLVPNGLLMIATPYARSFGYHQDPTHCSPWNEATPTYFCKGEGLYEVYRPLPWKIEKLTWSLIGNLEVAFRKVLVGLGVGVSDGISTQQEPKVEKKTAN